MSDLMHLASQAASALLALRRLEQNPKLSHEAFLAAAMTAAGIDEQRLADAKARFEASSNAALRSTVRQLARWMWQPTLPEFPRADRLGKLVSICEVKGYEFGCASAGITAAEIPAIAVAIAAQTHGDRFGMHATLTELHAQQAGLRARIHDLIAKMRTSYKPEDLRMEPPSQQPLKNPIPGARDPDFSKKLAARAREQFDNERAYRKRPLGPWLRAAPHISLANDDWPREFIECLLSSDPTGSAAAAPAEEVRAKAQAEQREVVSRRQRTNRPYRRTKAIRKRTLDEALA